MLILRVTLALAAVAALLLGPRSSRAAIAIAAIAGLDAACGAPLAAVPGAVLPLLAFLTAALTLAAWVERSGLTERAAVALAAVARGNTRALYAAVCALCAALTAVVSLDGAVVLMVPLVLVLARRWGAPLMPLFLGVVVVANAASIAVPQGNPTNLVVIDRLGLSAGSFVAHMLVPGLAAAAVCAAAVALMERRALTGSYPPPASPRGGLSRAEREAGLALAVAALAAWSAPLLGTAPWWPFAAAVALAHILCRERVLPIVPWRLAAQVGGLLVAIGGLGLSPASPAAGGLPELLAVSAAVGAVAAIANNLPVSASVGSLLAGGPAGYAASIGLAVGSLATPQGSVATMIASDLAGPHAPALPIRRLALLAALALALATVLLWALS
jgi:arsenical pump membrane protein